MTAPRPPFCRFCRHCLPGDPDVAGSIYTWARCELVTQQDPVSGMTRHIFCSTERTSLTDDSCGPHGKYFEPATVEA